ALAVVEPDAAAPAVDPSLPANRRSEIGSDCYALLLVLASARGSNARYQEALRLLDGARKLGFRTRAYHLRRAHFLDPAGAQDWEAAKAGLNACLTQQPDFVWAYLFRSFANEKLQALPDAEADFQRALQLNPNEDARYVLFLSRGILHFKQRELERAVTDFRS